MTALAMRALRGPRKMTALSFRSAGWMCPDCRPRNARSIRWTSSMSSSMEAANKPYYITTPIFYVNAAPHIGHLYTMVLADVLKRWQLLKGKPAVLCTGTDEHGMKIQQAAAKMEIDTREFCDANSEKFRALARAAGMANDFFIRTTDEDHKRAVEQYWLHLRNRAPHELGLYEGAHEGWYSVSDECFYPADLVRPSLHHQTGQKIMISTETESEVEWVSERTWFFPLKKYQKALLKFYDENPDWIQPRHRMNEVRHWVENHLEDLSVTRPASRLSWGITEPGDPSQTIYVWVDALINYLTKAGYGTKWTIVSAGEDQGLWPADVHVIGKDILRFHAIYWPALLMAASLPLPKKILCHNHWTMSNRKMSKSIGNVVNPFFAMERWGADPLRYFLMRNGSFSKDMDYSNELIAMVYEKDLMGNLGNLIMRVDTVKSIKSREQRWSTFKAVWAYRRGECNEFIEQVEKGQSDRYSALKSHLERSPAEFASKMNDMDCAGAIRTLFELLRETNRFIQDVEPWNLAKESGPGASNKLNWVIFQSSEALRIAGILFQPFMPIKASELLDQLGVRPERRSYELAGFRKDVEYGIDKSKLRAHELREHYAPLFPKPVTDETSGNKTAQQVRLVLRKRSRNRINRITAWLALEAEMGEDEATAWLAKRAQEMEASLPRRASRR